MIGKRSGKVEHAVLSFAGFPRDWGRLLPIAVVVSDLQ